MSLNDTISNIQYDWAFLNAIRNSDDKKGNKSGQLGNYYNGVPFNHYVAFKTICLMPDNENGLTSKDVQKTCENVFALEMSQPSFSRAIAGLKECGLVEGVNNPMLNQTLAWIKLTSKGRKLQRLFLGSTADWKDRLRIVSLKNLSDAIFVNKENQSLEIKAFKKKNQKGA